MNILIVEDDSMHVNFLKEILVSAVPEAENVFVAENGIQGEQIAREKNVSCIVMDLRMKDRNGIEAARAIWAERPATKILFWSNYSDEAYLRGVAQIVPEQAAYGYVLKTASAARMRLSLRAVLVEAQIVVDPEVHQIQHRQNRSNAALTDGEFEILIDLALGLPDKIIAERRNISLRTVQNRLLCLYDKLDVGTFREGKILPINKRVRAVSRAITAQIINKETLEMAENELSNWLEQ